MKRIEALIKPIRLEEVVDALVEAGIGPMTISESLAGTGNPKKAGGRRSSARDSGLVEQVRIDVVVPAHAVEHLVAIIGIAAGLGSAAGGTILVMPIERAVDVRTGEVDDDSTLGHLPDVGVPTNVRAPGDEPSGTVLVKNGATPKTAPLR